MPAAYRVRVYYSEATDRWTVRFGGKDYGFDNRSAALKAARSVVSELEAIGRAAALQDEGKGRPLPEAE